MTSKTRNGHTNLFDFYTVGQLTTFLTCQYRRVATDTTAAAGDYWLLAECLRELRRRKRIAPTEWAKYLTKIYGFDCRRLELAEAIRNNHQDFYNLSDLSVSEAAGHRRGPEVDGDGQAKPSRDDRHPAAESASPANQDGNGAPSSGEEPSTTVKGLQLLSTVKARRTEWLWENYIPLGEMTVVEGHPGDSKSTLMDDLAARLTTGRSMPNTADGVSPLTGGVLILVGEDSVAKTVVSRLAAAGADLARSAVLDDVVIPDGLPVVEKAIRAIGARLLIVDTLNDFLACSVAVNQQVRRALRPLRELAERTGIAVVLLRHLVKSAGGHSLLRGGGGVGITAMARSQLKVCRHPDDPDLRVLIHDKCNLGPLSPSLLFEVVRHDGTCRLEWHGECAFKIEDLDQRKKASRTLEAAERFLLEQLADGPKEVNWLVEHAKGLCSKRTLDEAKRNLGIKTSREGTGHDHKAYWSLGTLCHEDSSHSLQSNILQGVEPETEGHEA